MRNNLLFSLRFLLWLPLIFFLPGCAVFLSKGERSLLKNGEAAEVTIKKKKADTWLTELPGTGRGEIVKDKRKLNSDYQMGVFRSSDRFSKSRSFSSRALVLGDSAFGEFGFQKTTYTSYNSAFKRKLLNRSADSSSATHYSSHSAFGVRTKDWQRMNVLPPSNVRLLSPMFEPVFRERNVSRILIYNNKVAIGRIRLKANKNKVLTAKNLTEEEKKYVYGLALSVHKKALIIPK